MKASSASAASVSRTVGACGIAAIVAACGGSDSAPAPDIANLSVPPLCVASTETVTISGDGQTAPPGTTLPERLTARFTCESYANRGTIIPMTGLATWVAALGRADGEAWTQRTLDANGKTAVTWTLANRWDSPQAMTVVLPIVRTGSISAAFDATVEGTTTTARSCADPGGTDRGARTVITTDTAWAAADSPHRGGTVVVESGALSVEAGSVVCVSAIEPAAPGASGAYLSAHGTAQAPIRFIGTALRLASTLRHVEGENLPEVGRLDQPVMNLADSTLAWTKPRDPSACAQVVAAIGSAMQRTVISGYGSADCAALRLIWAWDYAWGYEPRIEVRVLDSIGDGVWVFPGAALDHCEVASSGRHGIVVLDDPSMATMPVSRCNLFGNAGSAIVNRSPASIDARGNWWGDPAGPAGSGGDGVAGAVDASDPLAAPVALGY